MTTARELRGELKRHQSVYKCAIEEGNLGLALKVREEVGKLALREMDALLSALEMFGAPLSEPEDDEDRIPF